MWNPTLITGAIASLVVLALTMWGQHYRNEARELFDELQKAKAELTTCELREQTFITQARENEERAAKALAQAQSEANRYAIRADNLLKKPAALPGDDCGSAKIRASTWLKERGR